MKRIILLWICIFALGGCAFFKHSIRHPKSQVVDNTPLSSIVDGQVIQKLSLVRGGDLLIVPFNPGSDVAASDEFERASLMMVKGVAQILQQTEASPFRVLTADNADQATLYLKGHILKMETKSSWKKWIKNKEHNVMVIEGKIIDRATGQDILSFRHTREENTQKSAWDDLAFVIGEDIGNFILTSFQ